MFHVGKVHDKSEIAARTSESVKTTSEIEVSSCTDKHSTCYGDVDGRKDSIMQTLSPTKCHNYRKKQ